MIKKPAVTKKIRTKRPKRLHETDPVFVLFTAIRRLLPKFGIRLDIPDVHGKGIVVRSKKSEMHPYALVMELAEGMLTYGIQYTKSYPPEPHYAVETAVAFAIERLFCFSATLDSAECAATEPEEMAGQIVQRFTACVMACIRAPRLMAEIDSEISAWADEAKRENPLTA